MILTLLYGLRNTNLGPWTSQAVFMADHVKQDMLQEVIRLRAAHNDFFFTHNLLIKAVWIGLDRQ